MLPFQEIHVQKSVILLEIYVCTIFNLLILFQKIHKIYDVLYRLKMVSLSELDVIHQIQAECATIHSLIGSETP